MPQSLGQVFVFIVFSTKNRERILAPEIRDELHAYIGGIMGITSGEVSARMAIRALSEIVQPSGFRQTELLATFFIAGPATTRRVALLSPAKL